jgi:hypothetical protein
VTRRGVPARAVVGDLDSEAVIVEAHAHHRRRAVRVTDHVRQRLLDDAVRGRADLIGHGVHYRGSSRRASTSLHDTEPQVSDLSGLSQRCTPQSDRRAVERPEEADACAEQHRREMDHDLIEQTLA